MCYEHSVALGPNIVATHAVTLFVTGAELIRMCGL